MSIYFLLTILMVLPAMAGEYAVLSTGFRIHANRHEMDGDLVRLYTNDGIIQVPSGSVAAYEEEEYLPPPPAAPLAPPPPATFAQPKAHDPRSLVREAAIRSGLPPAFVESVAKAESAMKPGAVSPKGAIGVMQLMPSTAQALSADPHDTGQNIDAGTRLLRDLLLKYDGDVVKALAAYNAGPGAVERYQGLPPYRETQNYVNKVIRDYQKNAGQ